MIRLTRSRRHVAALASTALAAGALAVLPGLAGLSAASAAPVNINHNCVMDPPGPTPAVPLNDAVLSLEMTVPESVNQGETFESTITATLNMGTFNAGPVTQWAGELDLAFTVGGEPQTVSVPITPLNVAPNTSQNVTVTTGAKKVTFNSPAALGADKAVVYTGVTGDYMTTTLFGPGAAPIPCTIDDGAAPGPFGAIDVVAPPAGVKYNCAYQAWTFPAYLTTATTLPASVNEDTALNPAMTANLVWGGYWSNSSRNINMTFQGIVAELATSTSGKAGTGTLSFPDPSVPASGAMAWAGTGSYGAVDTANPGSAALSYGNLTIKGKVKNNFTGGQFVDATIPCTAAQTTAMGTVAIADVAEPPAVTKVPVSGKVKITGAAKVGKKLTAVPGKAAGAKITYKWFSNGKAIKKATGKTLKLTKALKGKKVTVKVTYAKTGFTSVTQTSKAVKVKK